MKRGFVLFLVIAFLMVVSGSVLGQEAKPAPVPSQAPAKLQPSKTPAKKKNTEIAFFQLEAQGDDNKIANVVSDTILIEISKLPDTTVIGSKEIEMMLNYEQKKQMTGCTDTGCMVAIGGAMGVDKILTGSVSKLSGSYVLNLKLLDIKSAKIETMVQKRLKGATDDDVMDAVPEALSVIFPAQAAIWAGRGPAKPATGGELQKEVEVRGVKQPDSKVGAVPSDRPAQAVNRVVPWVLVGVGGAAVVAGGVLTGLAVSDYNEWKQLTEVDPRRDQLKSSYDNKMLGAYIGYGVGAAAIAGGLIWYFVAPKKPATSMEVEKKASLDIAPMIGSSGSGLLVTGTW